MSLVAKRRAAGAFSQSRAAGEAAIMPRAADSPDSCGVSPRAASPQIVHRGGCFAQEPAAGAGCRTAGSVPCAYRMRTVREVVTPRFVALVPGVTSTR